MEVNGCLLDVPKALIQFSPELLPVEEVIPMTVRSAEDPETERHNAVEFFLAKSIISQQNTPNFSYQQIGVPECVKHFDVNKGPFETLLWPSNIAYFPSI